MVADSPSAAPRLLLDRRTLLVGVGAACAVALLPDCGGSSDKKKSTSTTTAENWTLLTTLQAAVRASPDHLSARAADIIAAGDTTAAVRFVRDNIAVLPWNIDNYNATAFVRWGPDATLRAGAGTQRERADLLFAMLTAMGASPKLYDADLPAGIDAAALYATRPPAPSIDIDALSLSSDAKAALAAVPITPPADGADSIAASLLALIPPATAVAFSPFSGLPTDVPVIEYTAGGTTRWAFALGTIDEVTTPPSNLGHSDLPAPQYPTVTVSLLARAGDLPGAPAQGLLTLATGSWTTDQLAGGRLMITTAPVDAVGSVGQSLDQIGLRAARLVVQQPFVMTDTSGAVWTPKAAPPVQNAAGSAFTLGGAQLTAPQNPGDPVVGPYGPVLQLDDADHATALASVATLDVQANGGAFPDIQLSVAALNGSGTPVFGLTQSDFVVTDESATEAPVMLSNAAAELKVMLAYDCSGSVTWPSQSDEDAFNAVLASAMVTSAATTPFQLGYADLGADPARYGPPDAATILGDIASCESNSAVWSTLGQTAVDDGILTVVMVSDFVSTDDPATIPALKQRIATSGLAVALVPVSNDVDHATVAAIAQACGGTVLDWTAADFQTQLTTFITNAATRANSVGYRSTYRLPAAEQTNQGTRTVNVALAKTSTVSASAQYVVPAVDARGAIGIGGLYVDISVNGETAVRRHLAGALLDNDDRPSLPVTSDFAAANALLNGYTVIAFEPGNPTASINADDFLSSALTLEPVAPFDGMPANQAVTQLEGVKPYHTALSALMDPFTMPAAATIVTPQALRIAIMTDAATDDRFTRRIDIPPKLNLCMVAEPDAATYFAKTMRGTIPLSLREGAVLPASAAQALAGATLQFLPSFTGTSGLTGFSNDDFTRWDPLLNEYSAWHRLVPTTPATGAMWVVDPNTGTTIAVFLDRSGGSCGGAAETAAFQSALALIQFCGAAAQLACSEFANPYTCVGWVTAGIYATGAAILQGAATHNFSNVDVAVTLFMSTFGLFGMVGVVGAGLGIAFTVYEQTKALDAACRGVT